MGAMYRLKAYFGMVPAEEMAEYDDEPVADRYVASRRTERASRDGADGRWNGGHPYAEDRGADDRGEGDRDRGGATRAGDRYDDWDRRATRPTGLDRSLPPPRDREPVRVTPGLGPSAVRGALAVDPDAVPRDPLRPPVAAAVPEQRDRGAAALSCITTLQPRSYNEARTIGERYRDGVPVIMNLTELDDAAAKRLVDFAAGLAFALRGSIDKVANRVFLLTPADVEVSADDARKLAERGLFRQD